MPHRLQNRIAASRYALPVAIAYAVSIWLLGGLFRQQLWLQLALMLMGTLAMVELNNQHALTRTYSRMLSCSFLMLSMAVYPIFLQMESGIVQLCVATAFIYLFRAYQDKSAVGSVFRAFLLIGLASIWFVQILFLVPVWWVAQRFYVVAMSWRTFCASLLALATPYWLMAGYNAFTGDLSNLTHHFSALTHFAQPLDLQAIPCADLAVLVLVLVLGATGMLHFLLNASKDKIRVRLLFSTFILTMLATAALILLQPALYPRLLPILIVSVAPLIGHYITFTSSRLSGIICLLMLATTLALTGYQLWMH